MKFMLMMHAPRGTGGLGRASHWPPEDFKAHIGFMHAASTRSSREAGELVGAEGLAAPGAGPHRARREGRCARR